MIKRSIHQEDITIVNIKTLNIRAPKYIKHTLTELRGEININKNLLVMLIPHS